MTQSDQRSIQLPSRPETLSAGGVQLLRSPSASGNEILEVFAHHAPPQNQTFHISRSTSVDILQQTLHENLTLRGKVQALEGQMAGILSALGLDQPPLRELTKSQAKREVAAYFEAHPDETIYPSDIAEELHLSYEIVIDAIRGLERTGTIAKDA